MAKLIKKLAASFALISLLSSLLVISPTVALADENTITENFIFSADGASAIIDDVIVNGGTYFVSGLFDYAGGTRTGSMYYTDGTDGEVDDTFTSYDGETAIAISDGSTGFFVGDSSNSTAANRLRHVQADGTITTFGSPNGAIRALWLDETNEKLYVGGEFTSISSTARNRMAGYDVSTLTSPSLLSGFNPNVNGIVRAITAAADGNAIIAGGDFTDIGGTTRNRIAKINSNGTLASWDANADDVVRAVFYDAAGIYIGGDFLNIGGEARNRLALLDDDNAEALAWNPDVNGSVYTIEVRTDIFVGGSFTDVGGNTRNRIAKIAPLGAIDSGWNPNVNGNVYDIATDGTNIFFVGDFTTVGSSDRWHAAAVTNAGSATLSATWVPQLSDHGNVV
ncbi:MAG: delta-60 repeat domain-containing protein, partial [Anaerolineales bacterium]|nr:delta-60 repeat domain-containing protein [Anaerolineales bacterium]